MLRLEFRGKYSVYAYHMTMPYRPVVPDTAHSFIQHHADLPAIDAVWAAMFPDPGDRPARQVIEAGLQRANRVQHQVMAVL